MILGTLLGGRALPVAAELQADEVVFGAVPRPEVLGLM